MRAARLGTHRDFNDSGGVMRVSLLLAICLWAASCSAPPCGPSNCQGCCSDGLCHESAQTTCGSGGATCDACTASMVCMAGKCTTPATTGGGTGGGSVTGGGAGGGGGGGGGGGATGGGSGGGSTGGGGGGGGGAGRDGGLPDGGHTDGDPCTFGTGAMGSWCTNRCTNTQIDTDHCGSCMHPCTSGQICQQGACVARPCVEGTSCSPADGGLGGRCCAGACIPVTGDTHNCGYCNVACASGATCANGQCSSDCDAGTCEPGSTCTRLPSTPSACFPNTCTPTSQNDYCALTSGSVGVCCGAGCVDVKTDSANCGSCGRVCAGGTVCAAGTCQTPVSCSTGSVSSICTSDAGVGTCCHGACGQIDTLNDPANCGVCGAACPSNATCQNGNCRTDAGVITACGTCPSGTDCLSSSSPPPLFPRQLRGREPERSVRLGRRVGLLLWIELRRLQDLVRELRQLWTRLQRLRVL